MAKKNTHNKPIAISVPSSDDGKQPRFSKIDFEKAVDSKAYEVETEKAMRCPCSDKGTNAPSITCMNCGGTGWFFVEKKLGWAVVQSFNRTVKNTFVWSEKDTGTVSITMNGEDYRFGWMDRITVVNMEADFSEIARTKLHDNNVFSFLFYNPKQVQFIYLFKSYSEPLVALSSKDYTIEDNKIIFKDSILSYLDINSGTLYDYLNDNSIELSFSMRYVHPPTFNVIEVNREMSMNRTRDQATTTKTDGFLMRRLPLNALARRTHLIMDAPNYYGTSLYDNTIYDV